MRERATESKIKRDKERVKDTDPRTQNYLPLHPQAFASKIHALTGIFSPRPAVTWRVFNFLLDDHTKDIYSRTQRHLPSQPKAFASKTKGICLQNSRTQRHLPAKTRRDMEVFQLLTPWSHQKLSPVGFPFSCTNYSSDFALTPAWMSYIANHPAS